MEQEYKCIEDYQAGDWCVGVIDTAAGWLDRAIGWRDSDDSFESDEERDKFIKYYENAIATGKEQELIDYVADVWQIRIVPYTKPDYKQMYDDYSKEWAFSARMYFTLLKLALGHPEYSSYETMKAVRHTDEPYKKVLRALNEIDENGEPTRKSIKRD